MNRVKNIGIIIDNVVEFVNYLISNRPSYILLFNRTYSINLFLREFYLVYFLGSSRRVRMNSLDEPVLCRHKRDCQIMIYNILVREILNLANIPISPTFKECGNNHTYDDILFITTTIKNYLKKYTNANYVAVVNVISKSINHFLKTLPRKTEELSSDNSVIEIPLFTTSQVNIRRSRSPEPNMS